MIGNSSRDEGSEIYTLGESRSQNTKGEGNLFCWWEGGGGIPFIQKSHLHVPPAVINGNMKYVLRNLVLII